MKPLLLAFNLLCGADATSTHLALHRASTQPHAVLVPSREVGFPTQNPWVIDGLIAGQAVGASSALVWLDRHGHPRMARVIGWTAVVVHGVAVVQNVRMLRRQR